MLDKINIYPGPTFACLISEPGLPQPLRDDSVLRTLSSLRSLRGAPAVPPLCRETQSVGQQMLKEPLGINALKQRTLLGFMLDNLFMFHVGIFLPAQFSNRPHIMSGLWYLFCIWVNELFTFDFIWLAGKAL